MRKALAGAAAGTAAYEFWLKPWHTRWGATDAEVAEVWPGDELVAPPASQITRAITIDAPVEAVWHWVIQLGADRGGFYSYDWLENLFGLDIHSADRIVEDWQERAVGDLVYAERAGRGGWYVMECRPNELLVLDVANVKEQRPARRDEGIKWEFLWSFALRPAPVGGTRLLVRERAAFGSPLSQWALSPFGFVSFVMTRKMMLGIKARAEAAATTSPK